MIIIYDDNLIYDIPIGMLILTVTMQCEINEMKSDCIELRVG